MFKIFVCANASFGEWAVLEYQDRDLANVIAKDFIKDGNPVITFNGKKFRVWNSTMNGQPKCVNIAKFPEVKKEAEKYNYFRLYDLDWLGLVELYAWTFDETTGIKKVCQAFYTYGSRLIKSKKLFEVISYE